MALVYQLLLHVVLEHPDNQKLNLHLSSVITSNNKSLLSTIDADISAPTPNCGQQPSTVTKWLVFITELMIASLSIGRMVRKLITSQLMPLFANSSAASSVVVRARENDTNVTSVPGVHNSVLLLKNNCNLLSQF